MRTEKDLAFMRNRTRWPQSDYLCLKRYIGHKPDGSITEVHFGQLFWIWSGKHYQFMPEDINLYPMRYGGDELLVELTNAGWMVD
jgi:hypothetical protein